jgi:hypothetical protein
MYFFSCWGCSSKCNRFNCVQSRIFYFYIYFFDFTKINVSLKILQNYTYTAISNGDTYPQTVIWNSSMSAILHLPPYETSVATVYCIAPTTVSHGGMCQFIFHNHNFFHMCFDENEIYMTIVAFVGIHNFVVQMFLNWNYLDAQIIDILFRLKIWIHILFSTPCTYYIWGLLLICPSNDPDSSASLPHRPVYTS